MAVASSQLYGPTYVLTQAVSTWAKRGQVKKKIKKKMKKIFIINPPLLKEGQSRLFEAIKHAF
jgi:hypothetical protein